MNRNAVALLHALRLTPYISKPTLSRLTERSWMKGGGVGGGGGDAIGGVIRIKPSVLLVIDKIV